jgi:hypothetical protein
LEFHFIDTCVFHSFIWNHFHAVLFVFPLWFLRNRWYCKTTRRLNIPTSN